MPKALQLKVGPGGLHTFINPLKRQLGLEIELSNIGEFKAFDFGPIVQTAHDGSLEGPNPIELIVSPLQGDGFVQHILELAKQLDIANCAVNESCGLHVHVNARDFSPFDLRRFLQIYSVIEHDVFIHLLAPHRSMVRHCALMTRRYDARVCKAELPSITESFGLPQDHQGGRIDSVWLHQLMSLQDKREIQSMILHWLYFADTVEPWEALKVSIPDRRRHKYESKRYAAVNLHSWQERGTLEWRQCEGTIDPIKLIMWPLFCGWVVELSSILTDTEAKRIGSLKDLVTLQWPRPLGGTRQIPQSIRDWVLGQINKEK